MRASNCEREVCAAAVGSMPARLFSGFRRGALALALLAFAGVSLGGVAPPTADALTLQVNSAGVLTGALGVDVGGDLLDVQFVDGSCASVFSGCDDASDFDVTSSSRALAIGSALSDQVFVDGLLGAFDTDPSKTFGCTGTAFGFCQALIPTSIQAGVSRGALFIKNFIGVGGTQVFFSSVGSDLSRSDITFVRFTPSAVPVPAALPLMATVALLPICFRRRRHARGQSAA